MNEYIEYTDEEIARIIEQYRNDQLKGHLIGPVCSGIIHILMLLLLMSISYEQKIKIEEPYNVKITELEIKPVDKKIEVKIKEIVSEKFDENIQDAVSIVAPNVLPSLNESLSLVDVSDEAPETEDNLDLHEMSDVINNVTPLKTSAIFGGRTKQGIAGAVKKYGGTPSGQNSVDKALTWLAKVQLDNGSWENNPAHTGLALLCFLAHGDTPLSEKYGVTVQKSIQWLAVNMPENQMWGREYSHAIATYAISEAYGMTKIPFLISPMESGIDVIIKGQQINGGFDYAYKKGERWDVSVVGWQMQAMKAAYISGCTNPELKPTMDKSVNFMQNIAYSNSKFGYTSPGSGSPNMTGVGCLSLILLGDKNCNEVKDSLKWIMENRVQTWDLNWEDNNKNLYGWYYETQAVFQNNPNGKDWNLWKTKFQNTLIRNQHSEGYWTFEKDHHGIGGETISGKILSTTLCCLQLEVFYRYLPTFSVNKTDVIEKDILVH